MKERPMLFSGAMVRAILGGRKTQTRRLLKLTPAAAAALDGERLSPEWDGGVFWRWPARPDPEGICDTQVWKCAGDHRYAFGLPGDRLWCRETWVALDQDCRVVPPGFDLEGGRGLTAAFRADHIDPKGDGPANPMTWRPSIHMPRWASRLTLEITDVRVERLQDISEPDARAEGVDPLEWSGGPANESARAAFRELWESLNAARAPWSSNPWVWCLSFRVAGAEKKAVANG